MYVYIEERPTIYRGLFCFVMEYIEVKMSQFHENRAIWLT